MTARLWRYKVHAELGDAKHVPSNGTRFYLFLNNLGILQDGNAALAGQFAF